MLKNILIVILFFVSLMSCAVSRQQMVKETLDFRPPVTLETNIQKSLVYVVRPDGYAGLVSFEVSIDKTVLGKTLGGQYIYFYLVPGNYKIVSKAENSAYLEIMTEPGKTYYIKQKPTMGLLFARNELGMVDEVEGKYALKISKVGEMKEENYPVGK
jgi:hypothetical protein